MEGQEKTADYKLLQWHPAFFSGLQIEFGTEAEDLIFENEHQIGTKPMEIDVLIIKKEKDRPIHKSIGRIFRKYNIIEYKSPEDYLSIDDFYKIYGYACFYKADRKQTDSIKIEDVTISLFSGRFPHKLMKHLQDERGYIINKTDCGIYQISRDKIPMQVIVTKELSEEEYLWLRNLTDSLKSTKSAERLIGEYRKNKENSLYSSVMNLIVRANREKFLEVKNMCEALRELMKDELEAERSEGKRIGEMLGREAGEKTGKRQVNDLTVKLCKLGRVDDLFRAAQDEEYQKKLFMEFGL